MVSTSDLWAIVATAGNVPALERDELRRSLELAAGGRSDRVLLATCHRVELYGTGPIPATALQVLSGSSAVEHLLRVAAGLESAVRGEDEVLHQVRGAIAEARANRHVDGSLVRLFETAIAAGRKSRSGRHAQTPGLADRAVAWLAQRFGLAGKPVLVVGAGPVGLALARAVRRHGAELTVASRHGRVVHGVSAIDLEQAADRAPAMAATAVALAGPWAAANELPPTVDLSSPTAVSPTARARLGPDFLGIDDLFKDGGAAPRGYVELAETIVLSKTAEYMAWSGVRA